MSTTIVEGVNASETGDETHSLTGHEPEDVGSAIGNARTPVTTEEVARQIKAATDPLTRQLERPCDLMKELRQSLPKRSKETFGLIQGSWRPHGSRFNTNIFLTDDQQTTLTGSN